MKNLKELQQAYADLGKEIEALEKEQNFPQVGDKIFYCVSLGKVESLIMNRYNCNDLTEFNNTFRTRQEAQDRVDYLQTLFDLQALAKEYNEEWVANFNSGQNKYFITTIKNKINVMKRWKENYGGIAFKKESLAVKALNKIGEERIIKMLNYLGY